MQDHSTRIPLPLHKVKKKRKLVKSRQENKRKNQRKLLTKSHVSEISNEKYVRPPEKRPIPLMRIYTRNIQNHPTRMLRLLRKKTPNVYEKQARLPHENTHEKQARLPHKDAHEKQARPPREQTRETSKTIHKNAKTTSQKCQDAEPRRNLITIPVTRHQRQH
ncbi:hypothetical protein C2G38_2214365 [Gigaspora rosea]|uniref:Uncharacterized protein n=1 Tax=Gigaspora rosea TaxID=44941 RepID=A0A397UJX4_9GLOM|nr:hypothetical protein C2G38_2214365 [Gigaspora rosea]